MMPWASWLTFSLTIWSSDESMREFSCLMLSSRCVIASSSATADAMEVFARWLRCRRSASSSASSMLSAPARM